MVEEETREQIEGIINNNEEPLKEAVIETIIEEEEEIKPKSKARSRAKPNIEITKESVEPIASTSTSTSTRKKPSAKPKTKTTKESVVEEIEPVVEEPALGKIYKLKQIVKCPDCNMDVAVHTLTYIHKRREFCKAEIKAEPEQPVPEPEQQPKPKITEDIANYCIKRNHDIVSTYLRNERSMKAQRKQMHVRSLLNNAF